METPAVRSATAADRAAIADILESSWGETTVVVHATVYDALALPALLAERDGRIVGLLTYRVADGALEVVSMDATVRRGGTGSALLSAAVDLARRAGCGGSGWSPPTTTWTRCGSTSAAACGSRASPPARWTPPGP
jgi:GNAT superfamily N-acetyltransferase